MTSTLLSQGLYYVPGVFAHVVALVVAAVVFGRARTAALLLAGGSGLQLLASAVSYASSAWAMSMTQGGSVSARDVGAVTTALALVATLVRAAGQLGVVAAVVAAVFGPGRGAEAGAGVGDG